LPFLDRSGERHPFRGSRRGPTVTFAGVGLGVIGLTALGLADRPSSTGTGEWGLLPIAGMELATGEDSTCARCHLSGGPAAPLGMTRLTKDEEWLLSHLADPVAIAPGVRSASDPAPRPVLSRFKAQAVVAYLRRQYAGDDPPVVDDDVMAAALTYANVCVACHRISGNGGTVGPDLTHVGSRRDEATLRRLIEDPLWAYPQSMMPPFKERLSGPQIAALARYLASRR